MMELTWILEDSATVSITTSLTGAASSEAELYVGVMLKGTCFCSRFLCTLQRSWLSVAPSRSKPSQLSLPVWSLKQSSPSQLSQRLPEPAHSTGSHSNWRLTSRRLIPSQPPRMSTASTSFTERERSNIDRLNQATLSKLFHRHRQSLKLHQQLHGKSGQ